ncbi:nickel pincer cofactor biosynthesis protein LarC [Halorubrum vacuolatum]|uniref:Putative nickel insertion protein n=1 Tax=Halorubrum vacuolatum TaxID=63740 RepID=A0A238X6F7_HALVU|nr:nickel pincer cofactor biosynthesis protein LarC [Halorubrum vacuolatum]SNR54280.1 hypothetical protein SAMN06264855_1146 [Halorubrum vacuolatum]
MRTLAFDGRTGAAGDMICAALIAAGADPAVLDPVEDRLPIRYVVDDTLKNGISATTVDVLLTDGARGHDSGSPGDHGRGHDDHDQPNHHDDHDQPNHHDDHAEHAGTHRHYEEVVAIVESMDLDPETSRVVFDAFELLGRAEAAVHGTTLEGVHFHEVGADDAIADVVGAALLLADLDVDRVVTTPIAVGGGEVRMSHGTYPIPAPAVVEIAERTALTLVGGPVDRELCTPTGAAILGAIAESVDGIPALDVTGSGYGAGRTNLPDRPNVLRSLVGEVAADPTAAGSTEGAGADETGLVHDDVAVLETTLDDATPEVLGGLHDRLASAGALDVTVVPTTMKKSRPGHHVTVICKPVAASRLAERLARETGTLGIRRSNATTRWVAERTFETATISVDGREYDVTVKLASTADGDVYDVSAEYDDAAAVAAETDLPIREVLRRAEAAIDP